jgi:hypothetical protein
MTRTSIEESWAVLFRRIEQTFGSPIDRIIRQQYPLRRIAASDNLRSFRQQKVMLLDFAIVICEDTGMFLLAAF